MSYEQVLFDHVTANERLVVMTAENRAAIRGLPERIGNRFIDVGICEQTLVGAAAGMALRGRVPVVHALAAFLSMRSFEFIRTDVGIPGLPVKLVGGFAGFLSEANGPTHQALEDIALMRGVPGMTVWCPADEEELLLGLGVALQDPAPWYIRYTSGKAPAPHQNDFQPGCAEVCASGHDVTLLTYGTLFSQCYQAADLLREQGLSVGLVNMRTLYPVDTGVILESATHGGLLVAVEDHFRVGGLYSIIAETLLERRVSAPVLSLAMDARWFKPALLPDVLAYEGFTAEVIARRVLRRLSSSKV